LSVIAQRGERGELGHGEIRSKRQTKDLAYSGTGVIEACPVREGRCE